MDNDGSGMIVADSQQELEAALRRKREERDRMIREAEKDLEERE